MNTDKYSEEMLETAKKAGIDVNNDTHMHIYRLGCIDGVKQAFYAFKIGMEGFFEEMEDALNTHMDG